MSKAGLPNSVRMRHDAHYVEELTKAAPRSIGKIIAIDKIAPNPEQPRSEIGDLSELTASIKQNGVLEPLLVKPLGVDSFLIIAGERRWRAATLAGLTEVPCIEMDLDERAVAEIALIENMQRKDLTVWEEADGLAFLSSKFDYTHEEIAKKIGKSRTTVTESLTVAGLPETIRQKCRAANINGKAALLEIARQFDEAAMNVYLQNYSAASVKKISKNKIQAKNHPIKEKKLSKTAAKNENSFSYTDQNNSFTLKIEFTAADKIDRRDVLRALKTAFDALKNSAK